MSTDNWAIKFVSKFREHSRFIIDVLIHTLNSLFLRFFSLHSRQS